MIYDSGAALISRMEHQMEIDPEDKSNQNSVGILRGSNVIRDLDH